MKCPQCGAVVAWTPASAWRPFCSERCRLLDLGDWLTERHVVPGEPLDTDGPERVDRAADTAIPAGPATAAPADDDADPNRSSSPP